MAFPIGFIETDNLWRQLRNICGPFNSPLGIFANYVSGHSCTELNAEKPQW